MATPEVHALLSASSAHRWLACTAAPRFEAQFPKEEASRYAAEGTLAHSISELYVQRKFCGMSTRRFNAELKKLQADELYDPEMLTTAETYVNYLSEKALSFKETPFVTTEVRVDFSHIAPEGFGTCDCVMIGGDTLHITDYKHGKGVRVSAIENPQMCLYALGALKLFQVIYGDTIKKVSMAICQPRLSGEVEEYVTDVPGLLAWGETTHEIAQVAYNGPGEFCPGDHCRFCRGRAQCRARANANTALEDFKDCIGVRAIPQKETDNPVLSDEEIADLLVRGQNLKDWLEDLQAYALNTILNGGTIPGHKVVEGKSNRAFRDADAALSAIEAAGYEKAVLYDYKAKSLSELEKLMGKKAFAEVVGDLVFKPAGKPTLVPDSDKRPAYSPAAVDFAGVSSDG